MKAAHAGLVLDEVQVTTTGDRIHDRSLAELGGKGLFVKEIEEALLAGEADFAVHSIKDVPGMLAPGLALACIPKREDPRDVLVAPEFETLARLPKAARIGTSSLRRAVAIRVVRPDLVIVPMRGNVDTRLRKVDAGECDAIVLARAGLVRLGIESRATEILEPSVSLPAVGQGALGIEVRANDRATIDLLAPLDDMITSFCVRAERGVLEALGGDCKTPLGAHAHREGANMHLAAFIAEPDGSNLRRGETTVPWPADPRQIGLNLGRTLLSPPETAR